MRSLVSLGRTVLPLAGMLLAAIAALPQSAPAANIALGKPATGTYYDGRFPMAALTDALTSDTVPAHLGGTKDLDNYWLAPQGASGTGATFTLDLLGVYDLSQVNLVNTRNFQHNGGGDSGTNAFQLQASIDGVTFTPLVTGNLPASNTATAFGSLSAQARFLKFQADSYYGVRAGLAEIEVDGVFSPAQPRNVVPGKPITGSQYSADFPVTAVGDGLIQDLRRLSDSPVRNSYWILPNGASGSGAGLDIDLQGTHRLSEFVLVNTVNHKSSGAVTGDSGTGDFQILVSNDGVNYTPVVSSTLTDRRGANPNNSIPERFALASPVEASFIRFQVDSYYGTRGGLSELAALGTVVVPPNRLAAFDYNATAAAGLTQSGFTAITDGDDAASTAAFSAADNGITLTVRNNPHANDRDRGNGGSLAGQPQATLLRDLTFNTTDDVSTAMTVELSGLKPGATYRLRTYGYDAGANANSVALWFRDPTGTGLNNNEAFVTAHQNVPSLPGGAFTDMRLTSDAAGKITLVARGSAGVSGTFHGAFFNGLEVFEIPSTEFLVGFDANNTNGGGGPTNRTQPGFVPLTLGLPSGGVTVGSASAKGITVTVTTDRTDTPTRDRNNTGESLISDFIFANNTLDVLVEGLEPGTLYDFTVLSQDTNGNSGHISRWFLNGSSVPIKNAHINFSSGANNLDAASFSFLWEADSTSLLISARDVPGRPGDLLFFNGLIINHVPEPATIVLTALGLAGAAGRLRRRLRRA